MDRILNEKSIACLMENGIKSGYSVVRNVYGGITLFKGEDKVYSNNQKLVYNDITKKYDLVDEERFYYKDIEYIVSDYLKNGWIAETPYCYITDNEVYGYSEVLDNNIYYRLDGKNFSTGDAFDKKVNYNIESDKVSVALLFASEVNDENDFESKFDKSVEVSREQLKEYIKNIKTYYRYYNDFQETKEEILKEISKLNNALSQSSGRQRKFVVSKAS
ncbi:MAG: hypothetical protein E7159_02550 [Firmicutes bacterium]|nr:hypothetical protein [Bacillota bacterium]